MILLWGLQEDAPMRLVYEQLTRMHAPVFFLNHRDIDETHVSLEFEDQLCGTIRIYDYELPLADVSSCYFRTHNLFDYAEHESLGILDERVQPMVIAEDILWGWAELTNALVINKPSAMASNDSKAYQASIIQETAFSIPEMLITTSPSSAKNFWKKHGEVIYKSNSSVRSIVRKLSANDEERLRDIRSCPTMFQQYIPGTDYRVHVVNTEVYACRIDSVADDYRYAESRIEAVALPHPIQSSCITLASRLGLRIAGIDLRQHPNGTWYCFEVNPSPGFSFYEAQTGHPIANAIARLLLNA